jgi:nitroreductase
MLALRRSISPAALSEPGPRGQVLADLLRIATRVPDHRRVFPWRFVVFEGDARAAFGEVLERVLIAERPTATEEERAAERRRFVRAPTVVAVISSPDPAHKTPVWEQELSCGAVCMQLLNGANAFGFGGVWLTDWCAYSPGVSAALGLSGTERVAGFVYLGTPTAEPQERSRADLSAKVTHWKPG